MEQNKKKELVTYIYMQYIYIYILYVCVLYDVICDLFVDCAALYRFKRSDPFFSAQRGAKPGAPAH